MTLVEPKSGLELFFQENNKIFQEFGFAKGFVVNFISKLFMHLLELLHIFFSSFSFPSTPLSSSPLICYD